MKLSSFSDANKVLSSFVPPARKFRAAVLSLNTMRQLLAALGNPQEQYKVIHVAGTSGKTSTAYFCASLLLQTGTRVGLTVSPHIDQVNERVQINLEPMQEAPFCDELGIFLDEVEATGIKPTYFEVLIAFAYWEFARRGVDYAVIEVGLGGRLDATNVIERTDKVCVITDIGFDHTQILGNTLPKIATEKAYITKPGNEVFMLSQPRDVTVAIRSVVQSQGGTLHVARAKPPASKLPLFQQRNWYLASLVVKYTLQRDGVSELTDKQLLSSQGVHIPARMEQVLLGNKTVIMDGSHNAQKMHALVTSMKQKYPGESATILLAMLSATKQKHLETLKELRPIAKNVIVTDFATIQDMRKIAADPERIAELCRQVGISQVEVIKDPVVAAEKLLNDLSQLLMVTGSFYLLNHVRPLILRKHD